MAELLDQWHQTMIANEVRTAISDVRLAYQESAYEYKRPCVVFKPRLYPDGDQWCVLFGENIMEGVVGFGDTPEKAMIAFDIAWLNAKAGGSDHHRPRERGSK